MKRSFCIFGRIRSCHTVPIQLKNFLLAQFSQELVKCSKSLRAYHSIMQCEQTTASHHSNFKDEKDPKIYKPSLLVPILQKNIQRPLVKRRIMARIAKKFS